MERHFLLSRWILEPDQGTGCTLYKLIGLLPSMEAIRCGKKALPPLTSADRT
jgi:hypothetical protein